MVAFWIDIEDRDGVRYGDGPIITATSWEYAPRLSQSGTFRFTMPANDPRAALCKPRRVVRCYTILDGAVTEIGAGIIDNLLITLGNPTMLTVSGNDLLRELTWVSTVDLALMEREEEAPYVATVTYEDTTEWTGYPTSIKLTSSRFLYIGSVDEFTTMEFTFSAVNNEAVPMQIQFFNTELDGWSPVQNEDGTEAGDAPFAQNGTIVMQKLDGWGKFDGRYIIRLWAPDGDLDNVTITDIKITRWVETDTALASVMAFAPAGWSLAGSPYYDSTAKGVYLQQAGKNVLECLTAISRQTGENFRLGSGRTIQWLRTDTPESGIIAIGPVDPAGLAADDDRAIVLNLQRTVETFELGSRVLPYGGGDETRLTLEKCTRAPPAGYVLSTTGNYIERTAAEIYLDAVIEMPIEDLRIKPTDSSNVQSENAANALYDWALEYLQTHSATSDSDVPKAYQAELLRFSALINPCDRVTVRYEEWRDGYQALSVNASLVALQPTVRIDATGIQTKRITFATQARWPKGDQDVTVDLINQALSQRGSGGAGGGTSMMVSHDIIGGFHWVDGVDGQVVGVHPDDKLTLLDLEDLIEIWGGLFVGRREGAHAGAFKYLSDEGYAIELQVTDSGGAPIGSLGSVLDVPNTFWIKLGRDGEPQITYLNDGSRDGIEKAGILSVPASSIDGYLAIECGTTLPDALDYEPGTPFVLQSPGDPNIGILYIRDFLDNWEMLIGAGYAYPHSHTSDETGGILSAGDIDASDVTYTPAELMDWDSDADPGNVDGALDQLAGRVDDLETTPAANAFVDLTDVPASYADQGGKIVMVNGAEDGLEFGDPANAIGGVTVIFGERYVVSGPLNTWEFGERYT